jgi:hypothetical protein
MKEMRDLIWMTSWHDRVKVKMIEMGEAKEDEM